MSKLTAPNCLNFSYNLSQNLSQIITQNSKCLLNCTPELNEVEEEKVNALSREEENLSEAGLAQPQDALEDEKEDEDNRKSFLPPILPHVSVCPEVSPVTEDPPDSPDMMDAHDGGGDAFDDSEFVGEHIYM